jgi:hypothetical protein
MLALDGDGNRLAFHAQRRRRSELIVLVAEAGVSEEEVHPSDGPLARVVQYPVQRLRDRLEERCRIGVEWQHAADLFNPRRDQLRQQTFA